MKLGVICDGISRDLNHALEVMNEFNLEYLLKVNSQNIPSSLNASEVYFFDEKRDNKLGYGLKLSIGLSNLIKMNKIQLDFSYMYNFSNLISPDYKSDSVPDVSNFNTLSISLVYLFNFTKNEI